MADVYERGDTVRVSLEVYDDQGNPTTPGTLTLTVRAPDGASTAYTAPHALIVNAAIGKYHADLPLTQIGIYGYQWETTSPGQVQGGRVTVSPAPLDVLPWSLSLEALKRRLNHQELGNDDDKLRDYLAAAVEQAQAHPPYGCGRLLIPDPPADAGPAAVRTLTMTGHSIRIPDARELTEVLVDGVAAEYRPLWRDGHIVALTFARQSPMMLDVPGLPAQRTVQLTGRFGFSTIPANLADAIYLLAARYHYEEAAQYADQVEILEGTAVQSYYRQLPPRTKLVFSTYAVAAGAGFTLS